MQSHTTRRAVRSIFFAWSFDETRKDAASITARLKRRRFFYKIYRFGLILFFFLNVKKRSTRTTIRYKMSSAGFFRVNGLKLISFDNASRSGKAMIRKIQLNPFLLFILLCVFGAWEKYFVDLSNVLQFEILAANFN